MPGARNRPPILRPDRRSAWKFRVCTWAMGVLMPDVSVGVEVSESCIGV